MKFDKQNVGPCLIFLGAFLFSVYTAFQFDPSMPSHWFILVIFVLLAFVSGCGVVVAFPWSKERSK